MTPDVKRSVNQEYLQIESNLRKREPRLGKGISEHIRKKKQAGEFEEAMRVRKQAVESKIKRAAEKLQERQNENLRNIILSDDLEVRALSEMDATLILHATGEIDDMQKRSDLQKVYDNYPEQDQALEENALKSIQEIAILVSQSK